MPLSGLSWASLMTLLSVASLTAAPAAAYTTGAYGTTNELQDQRLTGCPVTAAPAAAKLSAKSVQSCVAQCRSLAPRCAAVSFNGDTKACELSSGKPGTGACVLTAAEGWVTFSLDNFQEPSPAVGACQSANPCQNSGFCLSRTEQPGGSFVCACPSGYSGSLCQTAVPQPSWSSWSEFSSCSVTCGLGVRQRSRSCLDSTGAAAVSTVAACGSDSPYIYEACNATICPTWSGWSEWSVCNTTTSCGPGVRQRSRSCLSGGVVGKDCLGNAVESTPCNSVSCSIQSAPVSLNPVVLEPMVIGKGYVQIYIDTFGATGYVCSDGFDNDKEGAVVCRTLGFDGVQTLPAASTLPATPATAKYFLTSLQCTGTEQSLQSCQHSPLSNATECATKQAAYVLCQVNGRWTQWDNWESCDGKCGSATRNRNRTCTNPKPLGGGLSCDGVGFQEAACPGLSPCPVDGFWTQWSDWDACTAVCGGGSQTRRRACVQPQFGGARCAGDGTQTAACNTDPCPVNGYYEDWSQWGACSVTCGGGAQTRTRVCVPPANSGLPCSGPSSEGQSCANQNCPVDGAWGPWSSWSGCNATCGGGKSLRTRSCSNPAPLYGGAACAGDAAQTQDCNTFNCPVDGVLTSWSGFTACSASCGGGSQTRQRSCVGPFYGGAACAGSLQDTEACNSQPCPVDGQWSAWGSWGACNVTCGGGIQQRTRLCSNPAPANGGRNCIGSGTDTATCATANCPVDGYYTDWSTWSACSRTCGGGTSTRTRVCVPPQYGGLNCSGDASLTQTCNTQQCPMPGEWLSWQAWGYCSQTCSGGVRVRTRQCNTTTYGAALTLPCVGNSSDFGPCNADKDCISVRSCQDLKNSGVNYDMVSVIDPDGPSGPVQPFSVQCQLSGSNGFGYTVVNTTNMTLPGIYSHGSEAGGSIHVHVNYAGGVTATALNSLAKLSLNCSQYVRYTCRDAGIHYQNNVYLQATYWVNYQFQQMLGWAQPYYLRYQSVCACYATGSCGTLTTNVEGIDTVMPASCNCDRNERVDGIWDEGDIYDKDNLPVNEVWVGDTGDNTEWSFTFVGSLICWGLDPSAGRK